MPQAIFRSRWFPFILLLPTLLILVPFVYYPVLNTFNLSLYKTSPNGIDLSYSGLTNFNKLFNPSIQPDYWYSFGRSILFSIAIVGGGLAISLAVAVLANQKLRGIRVYRTFLIWPYAISPAIVGVVFLFMFNPIVGVVNGAWFSIFHTRPQWFGDPLLTPLLVILAAIWKNLGYNTVFYLAGMQNIGGDLIEAAAIDGANRWQRFWRIMFPLLSPFTLFLVITNLTFAFFDIFGMVDMLAGPGPNNSTTLLIYNLFLDLRVNHDTGLAAAESLILFVLVAGLTLLQFRTSERSTYYGA